MSHKNNKTISNNSNNLIFDGMAKLVLLIKHSLNEPTDHVAFCGIYNYILFTLCKSALCISVLDSEGCGRNCEIYTIKHHVFEGISV